MQRLRKVIERRELVVGSPNATVLETVLAMTERRAGAIPIVEDDMADATTEAEPQEV